MNRVSLFKKDLVVLTVEEPFGRIEQAKTTLVKARKTKAHRKKYCWPLVFSFVVS